MMKKILALDLFCGAGGLTHGLNKSGIEVVAGYDLDQSCKYPYEYNNNSEFINKSVSNISGSELNSYFKDAEIKVLVGCAPCQPFSSHTQKDKNRKKKDKWNLLNQFSRLINETLPQILSMENVPDLINQEIFEDFKGNLLRQDYSVSYGVVNCPMYGIPQTRKRLVLLASKLGEISLIPPTHKKPCTVRETIGQLPKILDGETYKEDILHRSTNLSGLNKKRIIHSKPGGTWRDWPEELLAECHKKSSGKSYPGVYGRMSWDEPSPTITTQFYIYGTGRFGHPEQDRPLSIREGALLQTFPINYKFVPPDEKLSYKKVAMFIGNAVPVRLGEVIGTSILNHIKQRQT